MRVGKIEANLYRCFPINHFTEFHSRPVCFFHQHLYHYSHLLMPADLWFCTLIGHLTSSYKKLHHNEITNWWIQSLNLSPFSFSFRLHSPLALSSLEVLVPWVDSLTNDQNIHLDTIICVIIFIFQSSDFHFAFLDLFYSTLLRLPW